MSIESDIAQGLKTAGVGMADRSTPIRLNTKKFQRYQVEGDKPGSSNGSYCVYAGTNYAVVVYKSWKTGQQGRLVINWKGGQCHIDHREGRSERRHFPDCTKQEIITTQKAAAKQAYAICDNAKIPVNNLYLEDGKVEHHDFFRQSGQQIVTPICNVDGEITSVQFISKNGDKKFLKGGELKGCFGLIGGDFKKALSRAVLLGLAEGSRTAASIYQATGFPVAVAYHAGNLKDVALAIKKKYPDIELIVCADDDFETPGNPGLVKAHEAAAAVGAEVVRPDFSLIGGNGTDFNDLAVSEGLEAVWEAFESLMSGPQKNHPGRAGLSESARGWNQSRLNAITGHTQRKTKYEMMIAAFLRLRSMNTFQAKKEYGDTCLRSSISDLFRKYQIEFGRESEKALNRTGRLVMVKRYIVTQPKRMEAVLAELRQARGENGS